MDKQTGKQAEESKNGLRQNSQKVKIVCLNAAQKYEQVVCKTNAEKDETGNFAIVENGTDWKIIGRGAG